MKQQFYPIVAQLKEWLTQLEKSNHTRLMVQKNKSINHFFLFSIDFFTLNLQPTTSQNQIEQLKSYPLNAINLLPPEDPCSVYPAQYEFAFSLLGMDVLKAFKTWEWDYQSKQLILK